MGGSGGGVPIGGAGVATPTECLFLVGADMKAALLCGAPVGGEGGGGELGGGGGGGSEGGGEGIDCNRLDDAGGGGGGGAEGANGVIGIPSSYSLSVKNGFNL